MREREIVTNEKSFTVASEDETISLGTRFGKFLSAGDVVALEGTLGAGKTTFTKGVALALGVTEEITSPTFCIINEYPGRLTLFHFDVYRLEGVRDFQDLGSDDIIYGNGVSLIEWSEKVLSILPEWAIRVSIKVSLDVPTSRVITIKNFPKLDQI